MMKHFIDKASHRLIVSASGGDDVQAVTPHAITISRFIDFSIDPQTAVEIERGIEIAIHRFSISLPYRQSDLVPHL